MSGNNQCLQTFMIIHPADVEKFQSAPEFWTIIKINIAINPSVIGPNVMVDLSAIDLW